MVEDDARLRFILHKQLESAGFDVIGLESGESALATLEAETPDLVLLNVLLTGIDGIEVCERIRANERLARLPVVFLTWKKDDETRARCFRAGASDYITKPWDSSDLVSRIAGLLPM